MEPTGPTATDAAYRGIAVPYADIIELLRDATGADDAWAAALGPAVRLDGDLFLDSLSVSAFADRLRARYGDGVDLLGHITTLDIDAIIDLSIADVTSYVISAYLSAGRG